MSLADLDLPPRVLGRLEKESKSGGARQRAESSDDLAMLEEGEGATAEEEALDTGMGGGMDAQEAFRSMREPEDGAFGLVRDARCLSGHIVVCGNTAENLSLFVHPLRRESAAPVLVMFDAEDDQPPGLKLPASMLRNVFFLRGSHLSVKDLRRAGMQTAAVAVILANHAGNKGAGGGSKGKASSGGGEEEDAVSGAVADLEAVFTTCIMEERFKSCRLVVEILEPESMKFMSASPGSGLLPTALWPQFACGRVFTAAAMDTLLCQAFYNPALLPVMQRLITGRSASELQREQDAREQEIRAANGEPEPYQRQVMAMRLRLLHRGRERRTALANHHAMQAAGASHGGAARSGTPPSAPPSGAPASEVLKWFGVDYDHELVTTAEFDAANEPIAPPGFKAEHFDENCQVVQMQVPAPFINRYYRDLFMELLLTQGILPIGMYRTQHVFQARLPYVVANPPPLTVLHADDRLFILCSKSLVQRAAHVSKTKAPTPSSAGLGRLNSSLADAVLRSVGGGRKGL